MLFSFLTTEPNKEVGAVHQKAMPVCLLTEQDRETWMAAPRECASELQDPRDGTLKIVATGAKSDPKRWWLTPNERSVRAAGICIRHYVLS